MGIWLFTTPQGAWRWSFLNCLALGAVEGDTRATFLFLLYGTRLGKCSGKCLGSVWGGVWGGVHRDTESQSTEMSLGRAGRQQKAPDPHHSPHRMPSSQETGALELSRAWQGLSQRLLDLECAHGSSAERAAETPPVPRGAGKHSQSGSGTCRQPCSPRDFGNHSFSHPRTRSRLSLSGSASSCKKGPFCRGRLDFGMEEEDVPGRRPWNSFPFLPGWCLRVTSAGLKSFFPSESCTHSKMQWKLKLNEQLLHWAPANTAGTWRGAVE